MIVLPLYKDHITLGNHTKLFFRFLHLNDNKANESPFGGFENNILGRQRKRVDKSFHSCTPHAGVISTNSYVHLIIPGQCPE